MAMRLPGPAPRKKRAFASTEHLSPEAVAAFADGELSAAALHRARVHVVLCDECRGEVYQQRAAAEQLKDRTAGDCAVCAPRSLVEKLTRVPQMPEEPSAHGGGLVDLALRSLKRRG